MPPQPPASSPSRPSRIKRESLTITRSVGKALVDVMNRDKFSGGTSDETKSDAARGTAPGGPVSKRVAATTREVIRRSRPSLDQVRGSGVSASDKSTPKLFKRPPTAPGSLPSNPAMRQNNSSVAIPDDTQSIPSERASNPRTSLTFPGLSSTLQPKSTHPPSALPKYKAKPAIDARAVLPRSGARKRLSNWDREKDQLKDEVKGFEDDAGDDCVAVERPISPLPRRATGKAIIPVSLSLTASTSPKKGHVLHKTTDSISSTPARASKVPRASPASTTPVSRHQHNYASVSRPSSSASVRSHRTTPVTSPARKPISISRTGTISSGHSIRRRLTVADDYPPSNGNLDASPGNPFQLPETSGVSLLSPPLSPFLEGVSVDSIDVGDVSALLSTVVSPVELASAPALPTQVLSRTEQPTPEDPTLPPPQTPILQSSVYSSSMFTTATDPRQSMLSIRQFLEKSGDLEHLLSQPLPANLTPGARERLLSLGFSPSIASPPSPPSAQRPEPQTPSPLHNETSISQVLFPQLEHKTASIELLKTQLASAEAQRIECEARIERLEGQLLFAREAREQEAAELSMHVSSLEEQLKELLGDREREKESERRAEDLETRLHHKDIEWEHKVTMVAAQMQEQSIADQQRILRMERRKQSVRSAAAAWECTKAMAVNELELVRSNNAFIQIILGGMNSSMELLRQSSRR